MPDQQPTILTHEQLLAERARARAEGRRVVQCHGCFDIVHPGHIRHLRFAKAQGDVLLVTITGDASVAKGDGRPLIPEELRAENLAELDCVDWVYIEPRPTAAELLGEVQPDVFIKGREYETNADPRFAAERETVERHGGRVVFSSGDIVFSSTALIEQLSGSVDPFHKRLAHLLHQPELSARTLMDLVPTFRGKRVVVVGETIIDTYVMCDRAEVAGESPMLTLRPLEQRRFDGGAAIVARHAAAMGAEATLVTALPPGDEAERFRRRLAGEGVEVLGLPIAGTIAEKQRFLVGQQKMMKLDVVDRLVLDASQQRRLTELAVEAAGDGCDVGIIADFGLGLLSPVAARELSRALRPLAGVLAGDVSGSRASLLSLADMDIIFPSERELRDAIGKHDEGLPAVAWSLMEQTHAKAAIVTLGADGLVAFDRLTRENNGNNSADDASWHRRLHSEHVPALAPWALDALGCGDTMLAATTLALASNASLVQASFIGAVAASRQAQRLGNVPVTATDLRQGIARVHSAHLAFATAEVVGARPNSSSPASNKPTPSDRASSIAS